MSDDTIQGTHRSDRLKGGSADEVLDGAAGDDRIDGSGGDDIADFSAYDDAIFDPVENAVPAGGDLFEQESIENVVGGILVSVDDGAIHGGGSDDTETADYSSTADSVTADLSQATATSRPDLIQGLKARFFAIPATGNLSEIDFSADPIHEETVDGVDFMNGGGSFFDGGPTDRFALQIDGFVDLAEGGEFTFHTGGDDGVRLLVDGQIVTDDPGLHGFRTRSGSINLEPGRHAIQVLYFENSGSAGLKLEIEGPGLDGRRIVGGDIVESGSAPAIDDQISNFGNVTGYYFSDELIGNDDAKLLS